MEDYKIDKYIYDEKNGLCYELQGDYYLPCLKLPKEESRHIGVLELRHKRYLKQNHKVRYYNLLTNGKPDDYLADSCNQAGKPVGHFLYSSFMCLCVLCYLLSVIGGIKFSIALRNLG